PSRTRAGGLLLRASLRPPASRLDPRCRPGYTGAARSLAGGQPVPRPLVALLTATALLAGLGAAPPHAQPTPPSWFPATLGARWAHRSTGGQETTLVVAAVEEKDGAKLATIALPLEDGKPFPVEKVSVSSRGLFRVWAYGSDCTPPVCLLRLPPVADHRWEN